MAWSTSQLAELAGTTLKTVRHYHRLGLLEEPARSANGYKRYGVTHLVRVMGIRRLTDLGVPLADIPSMEAADGRPEEILRALDAELAADIDRRQRMRREIAAVLEEGVSLGLPADFGAAAADLPRAQQSLLLAYSSILTPRAMASRSSTPGPGTRSLRSSRTSPSTRPRMFAAGWRATWRPRPGRSRRRTPSSRTWTSPPAGTGRSPGRSSRRPWSRSTTRLSSTSCAGCTPCSNRTGPPNPDRAPRGGSSGVRSAPGAEQVSLAFVWLETGGRKSPLQPCRVQA
ncbi:MerR family transcriptional regulator [Streptomyces cyaneofuscatus]|uniref:MerR family transcriptional regulator n=1 Tax=Streptomyces cyaneofuscatus TaxID=66883 RepID=UPI00365D0F70